MRRLCSFAIYFTSYLLGRLAVLDSALKKSELEAIWSLLSIAGEGTTAAGYIELTVLHNVLSGKFGKDKTASKAQNSNVIERVISKIVQRAGGGSGGAGIKGLSK